MSEHYKLICKHCNIIINQCRCPSNDKSIQYGECEECKSIEHKRGTILNEIPEYMNGGKQLIWDAFNKRRIGIITSSAMEKEIHAIFRKFFVKSKTEQERKILKALNYRICNTVSEDGVYQEGNLTRKSAENIIKAIMGEIDE